MAQLNPYIHFNGNAEEAFTFYQSVFGGEFTRVIRFKDFVNEQFQVPEHEANKLMNISLPISDGSSLIGSDVPEMMGRVNENDNRNTIYINTGSREEADKLFNGLSAGGKVEMPIEDGPFGSYFGMFTDKYGVEWMVDFTNNIA